MPAVVISSEKAEIFPANTTPFLSVIKPRNAGVVMMAMRLLSDAVEYL